VALPGFSKFFSEASKEEREHAEKLMEYVNKRGGDVQLKDVKVSQLFTTKSHDKTENGAYIRRCFHFISIDLSV
jgi:ferritin heavy chain